MEQAGDQSGRAGQQQAERTAQDLRRHDSDSRNERQPRRTKHQATECDSVLAASRENARLASLSFSGLIMNATWSQDAVLTTHANVYALLLPKKKQEMNCDESERKR